MAQIEEVFENFGENTKNLLKDKRFWLVALGVGAVALWVGWRKNGEAAEEESYYGPYEAIGYAGYPQTGGDGSDMGYVLGGSDSSDTSYLESVLTDYQTEYQTELDSLYTNIDTLSNKLISTEETISRQSEELQKQQDIAQMKANSELYNNITDRATKDALHAQNLEIAEKYGFEYDPVSGNYFDGMNPIYTTAQQQANLTAGKAGSDASVAWDNNVDYQAKINEAILSGADATTINTLNAQRTAKMNATGTTNASAGYDASADYTTLINKAKASGADSSVIANLTAQRQAKINDLYGGVDPDKASKSGGSAKSSKSGGSSKSGTTTKPSTSGITKYKKPATNDLSKRV